MGKSDALVVNGWTIFAHPLFLDQLEALIETVERARAKDARNYRSKNSAKRLAAIAKLALEIIPTDPEREEYRQGDTLGADRKHWRRAKFYQQYRLFFRYRRDEKIILYAWVNDEDTRRAYGSGSDAYAVFRKMLARNRPPDDWKQLEAECRKAAGRLGSLRGVDPHAP